MPRTALELLRLLAADAPAEQIEEKARALAAEDPDDGEAARELALRVRAGLDAHRRREAGLSALVDTARDLASLPDPGGVLDAIVRRARTLLRADVAYLTLFDPDRGDTYMRATAGLGVGAVPGAAAAGRARASAASSRRPAAPTGAPTTPRTSSSGTPARSTRRSTRRG